MDQGNPDRKLVSIFKNIIASLHQIWNERSNIRLQFNFIEHCLKKMLQDTFHAVVKNNVQFLRIFTVHSQSFPLQRELTSK